MRRSRLGLLLVLLPLSAAKSALAQGVVAPAAEPAQPPSNSAQPAPAPPAPVPEPPPAPSEPPAEPKPAEPPAGASPAPEPPPETTAPPGPIAPLPPVPESHAPPVAAQQAPPPPALPPWIRAHSPLTLEGSLGLLLRPDSSVGFRDETHTGAALALSLYVDVKREFAAGIELERASLGRGTSLSGLDSVSIDYNVTSAMLGVRAYPKRTEMFDVFVGLQVGVGIQGVSAAGTANNGALNPASSYTCRGSDSPALQIAGGVGARFMFSPRWGITGRINAAGRRLTGDVVDDCAQGLGTATTVTGSVGVGYDFDLDP